MEDFIGFNEDDTIFEFNNDIDGLRDNALRIVKNVHMPKVNSLIINKNCELIKTHFKDYIKFVKEREYNFNGSKYTFPVIVVYNITEKTLMNPNTISDLDDENESDNRKYYHLMNFSGIDQQTFLFNNQGADTDDPVYYFPDSMSGFSCEKCNNKKLHDDVGHIIELD